MDKKELKCFNCNKIFLVVIDDNKNIFYSKKTKGYSKIIKLTNISQEPITKYFCSQVCKNIYVFNVKRLIWYKI